MSEETEYRKKLESAFSAKIKVHQDENTDIDLMATRFRDMLATLEVIGETNTDCRVFSSEELGNLRKFIKVMISKVTNAHTSNMVRIEAIQDNIKALSMVDQEPGESVDTEESRDMEDFDENAPEFDELTT